MAVGDNGIGTILMATSCCRFLSSDVKSRIGISAPPDTRRDPPPMELDRGSVGELGDDADSRTTGRLFVWFFFSPSLLAEAAGCKSGSDGAGPIFFPRTRRDLVGDDLRSPDPPSSLFPPTPLWNKFPKNPFNPPPPPPPLLLSDFLMFPNDSPAKKNHENPGEKKRKPKQHYSHNNQRLCLLAHRYNNVSRCVSKHKKKERGKFFNALLNCNPRRY